MTQEEMFEEMAKITNDHIKNHPFDPDAHIRYVMSNDWKLPEPFIYKETT